MQCKNFICDRQLLLCLNFLPHISQANFGSTPHSWLICRAKCVVCLYVEPHFGQGYLPLASRKYLLPRFLKELNGAQNSKTTISCL